jgi:hypothetical protein
LSAAEDARREAARLLAEADAAERDVKRMREWVTRNGKLDRVEGRRELDHWRFVGWEFLTETFVPAPEPPPDERAVPVEPIPAATLAHFANEGLVGAVTVGRD